MRRYNNHFALAGLLLAVFTVTASAADRIVTLGGAVTEFVFALDSGDRIVARDSSSLYPEPVRALPDVGYFRTIGAEGVLALRPSLVLAAHGTGPESQVRLLEQAGVPLVRFDGAPSSRAVLANLRRLGSALGREAEAEALAEELRDRLGAVQRQLEGVRRPTAVFLMQISATSASAAFPGTAADALIALAGGANPLSGNSGYKTLTAEALLRIDPEVVFHAEIPGQATARLPGWLKATRAGRAGRIHTLDLGFHLSFGPRLAEAVSETAALIHPDLDFNP
ncbi:MAG: ABC transporter substrate-binding protein [Puniceicoccaceae bacterium]|nr:MAG: ABC transporter substrate-binding protein [Puniceicoccaceae bacterium]